VQQWLKQASLSRLCRAALHPEDIHPGFKTQIVCTNLEPSPWLLAKIQTTANLDAPTVIQTDFAILDNAGYRRDAVICLGIFFPLNIRYHVGVTWGRPGFDVGRKAALCMPRFSYLVKPLKNQ